jgi:hypothetical protein
MFVGFGSLAVALSANSWPVWASILFALGIIGLGIIAAQSAHSQRSIDRMVQFDRDFNELRATRRSAAAFLLGRGGRELDRDKVLDFFDTPLGHLTERGYLDEALVYDYFFDEIRGWWSANKDYIAKEEDKSNWEHFATLYETAKLIHLRNPIGDKAIILEGPELTEFLMSEFVYGQDPPTNFKEDGTQTK